MNIAYLYILESHNFITILLRIYRYFLVIEHQVV